MITRNELELLSDPLKYKNQILTGNIDISLLDKSGNHTPRSLFINALTKRNYPVIDIYIQCKNALAVVNFLLDDEECRADYFQYLTLSPECKTEALDTLAKCANRNKIIINFHEMLKTENYPAIDSESESVKKASYLTLFKKFLTKPRPLAYATYSYPLIKEVKQHACTPLEEAINNSDHQTCRLIFQILARDNPYLFAVINDNKQQLASLLKEVKAVKEIKEQDRQQIQQDLQIAALASFRANILFPNIPMLFEAGMQIYPTNIIYSPSILLYSLFAMSKSLDNTEIRSELYTLIILCLNILKPTLPSHYLQENWSGKNLLELAFATKNNEIFSRLKKLGARLPTIPIQEEPNILIQAIEEDKLSYFSSQLHFASSAQLRQAAEYCIINYNKPRIPLFLSDLLERKSGTVKTTKEKTLADLALELKQLPLLVLLEQYNIFPSKNKSSSFRNTEQKNIDTLCDFVRTGNLKQIDFIITNPEFTQLIYQRSSEGLTPTEIAVIYQNFDAFFMLTRKAKDYVAETDGVFDILKQSTIRKLQHKYGKDVHVASLLSLAVKHLTKINNYEYNYPLLKPLISSISQGRLLTQTIQALVKINGLKTKIIAYLKKLPESELDPMLEGLPLQDFFLEKKRWSFWEQFYSSARLAEDRAFNDFVYLYSQFAERSEKAKLQSLSKIQTSSILPPTNPEFLQLGEASSEIKSQTSPKSSNTEKKDLLSEPEEEEEQPGLQSNSLAPISPISPPSKLFPDTKKLSSSSAVLSSLSSNPTMPPTNSINITRENLPSNSLRNFSPEIMTTNSSGEEKTSHETQQRFRVKHNTSSVTSSLLPLSLSYTSLATATSFPSALQASSNWIGLSFLPAHKPPTTEQEPPKISQQSLTLT